MAVYATSFFHTLQPSQGGWITDAQSDDAYTAEDEDGDDTLGGSRITITAGSDGAQSYVEYVGSYGNGWVGEYYTDLGPSYFLFTNDPVPSGFVFSPDPAPLVVCFAAGTAIACLEGSRPVEALSIGDLVLTASGEARPVRWIGRQAIRPFFADRLRSDPIRIQAGALGENLPQRDLFVSPDHALFLDGLLVQAGALVNGSTIRQVAAGARFTYFHVELEDHALILAEGVPAESFVDNVTRSRFDNHAEYVALYGEMPSPTGEFDAPRVKSHRQLPAAIRNRLAQRAARLPPVAHAA